MEGLYGKINICLSGVRNYNNINSFYYGSANRLPKGMIEGLQRWCSSKERVS